jgi:Spy/CpxP family protein refolding chaperone
MKRTHKIVLSLVAVGLLATFAFAHGIHARHHDGPEWFKSHATTRINSVLDAAKATPAQRNAIHASLDHVFDTIADGHKAGQQAIGEAIQIFEAEKIDPAAVAKHRAAKEVELKKIGDAVVQFLHDTHDALTAQQRQDVVAFVKAQRAEHANHDFQERFMGAMIQSRIDDVLDQIKASTDQRTTVNAAKDRIIAAFKSNHAAQGADIEQLVNLFAADKLDEAKIDALRAAHLAGMNKIADAVVQSITEVHDALSPEQRTQLVSIVKAHHEMMGHHRG